MRALLAFALTVALPLGGAAQAVGSDLVITAGKRGGSYYAIAARLQSLLQAEHGVRVEIATSAGSVENLERLGDPVSLASVGLTQADALERYLEESPEFADEFLVLANVGKECAFVVASAHGPIESAADLKQKAGHKISVESESSGAAVTWENMVRLEPAFANTKAVHVEMMEALLQLKEAGEFTPLEAVMFVQRPLRRSPALELAFGQRDVYRFVPITARDLTSDDLPDGSAVYTFEEVAVGGRSRKGAVRIETVCTRGLLLGVKDKLPADLRALLSRVMLERPEIVGEDE